MTTYHISSISDLGGKRVTNHNGTQANTQRRFLVTISDGREALMTQAQLIDMHKRGKTITYNADLATSIPSRISSAEAWERI